MDKLRKFRIPERGGFYYSNEIFFSPAYLSLNLAATRLLHCLLAELRWENKKGLKRYLDNGSISFTGKQFRQLFNKYCSATFSKARNQLICVGFIKITKPGGNGRGDCTQYKILCCEDVLRPYQRWRKYPEKNWSTEVPKNKSTLGIKTRWKPGQSGHKLKTQPIKVGGFTPKPPIKVTPNAK